MKELIVDNFAGGGGASTGIELAIGRSVDIAINHDQNAIAMHETNHPDTLHYCESVFDVDPIVATAGYPVGLAWFSPDCTHFSKARGSTPVKKEIRGLAWIIIRWALLKRPRVIMLENVEEFKTWGPTKINENGDEFPDSIRAGETFKAFVDMLSKGIDSNHHALDEVCDVINLDRNGSEVKKLIKGLGYKIEFNELKACDYGAPTIRKRFFMVMRCDGQPIVWPEATHGDPKSADVINGKLLPYRTAAECIDWSIACPSIFDRKKPLAENTMKRIARGIKRFVIDNPNPFIVRIGQTGFGGDRLSYDIDKPLTTITTKAEHLLVSPTLIQYHTERNSSEVRGQDLESPVKTVDTNPRYALVASFLAKHFGGNYTGAGSDLNEPIHTVTATDHNALVTSHLRELQRPCKEGRMLATNTSGGTHLEQINAFLLKYYGNEKECPSLDDPLHTVTSKDRFGLVTIHGVNYQIVDIGMRMLQPHELYKAQGFPDWYVIDCDYKGKKYPKSAQVARCGNAVPPPFAEALVKANMPELCVVSEVA